MDLISFFEEDIPSGTYRTRQQTAQLVAQCVLAFSIYRMKGAILGSKSMSLAFQSSFVPLIEFWGVAYLCFVAILFSAACVTLGSQAL